MMNSDPEKLGHWRFLLSRWMFNRLETQSLITRAVGLQRSPSGRGTLRAFLLEN